MKNIASFIKTTLFGGLFLVIPIVLIIIIFGKALEIIRKLLAPITDIIPVETIGGIHTARFIAFFILLLICFVAGLLAKTKKANMVKNWIEDNVLVHIPGYSLIKGMTESAVGMDTENFKDVVLVNTEEVWQIGFLMDEIDDKLSTVYIPGAPNATSGDVFFIKNDRLKKLDLPETSAIKVYSKMGLDSKKILKGEIKNTSF